MQHRTSTCRFSVLILSGLLLLAACYNKPKHSPDAYVGMTEEQRDSLSFQSSHHFSNNYNFVVTADSLRLLNQQPEENASETAADTFAVYKSEHLVVADIRIVPTDTVDSVWIQLANDQALFGWVHESEMTDRVVPDDPISQFISIFSDIHLLIFLIFLAFIFCVYILVKLRRHNLPFVHIRDIDTFYPMTLCLIVATSATLYATLQLFSPEMWRHFYYHPTLNPFSVPPPLNIFLVSVWAIVIVALAAADDVFKRLPVGDALLYLGGVGAVCAVNYIIFSISTLYYIGYPLLLVYIILAVRRHLLHNFAPYACGNCGGKMRRKGTCPHCGSTNI